MRSITLHLLLSSSSDKNGGKVVGGPHVHLMCVFDSDDALLEIPVISCVNELT